MSEMNKTMAERAAALAFKAGTVSSTQLVTTAVNMAGGNFRRLMGVCILGDMAAETIDFRLEKCSDSTGTGAVALKSATQLAAHATNNDNKAIIINVDVAELSGETTLTYVRCRAVTGGATGGACGLLLMGSNHRHGPMADFDSADVVEIKN